MQFPEYQDKVSIGRLGRYPEVTLYDSYVGEAVSLAMESGPEMNHLVATDWRRAKECTAAGRELKISYGGRPGGLAPWGYRIEKDTKAVDGRRKRFSVLVADARESMALAIAAELVVDQSMNPTGACGELDNRKLFTRSGVLWTVVNLRNRLHTQTNHDGCVVYRRADRCNGKSVTLCCADGAPVHGEQVRIGVPPIFSEERAAQLMAALKRRGFQNGRRDNCVYPLTGRIRLILARTPRRSSWGGIASRDGDVERRSVRSPEAPERSQDRWRAGKANACARVRWLW